MTTYINPTALQPHPRNTAIYGAEDVQELTDRIQQSNWIKPLVITPEHRIISGHRRWRAALTLGLDSVPVEQRAFANDTEELEALLLENASRDKTTVQKVREAEVWREIESARARERQRGGQGGALLPVNLPEASKGETREKVAEKIGMSGSSYERAAKVVAVADQKAAEGNTEEAQRLLSLANKSINAAYSEVKREQERATRAAAPLPFTPAHCTIEQGSSTHHLLAESYDLICTDPPYGISAYGGVTKVGDQLVTADFDQGDDWDSADPAEFRATLAGWVAEWARLLAPGGALVAFTDKALISHLWDMCKTNGLAPKNILTWVKTNPSPAGLARKNLISSTEFLIWAVKPGFPYTFNAVDDWDRRNVITAPLCGGHERTEHPTQKPQSVLRPLVACFSKVGDLVLDPFAGSGSTGVAALSLDREVHLIEQNPEYVTLARHVIAASREGRRP